MCIYTFSRGIDFGTSDPAEGESPQILDLENWIIDPSKLDTTSHFCSIWPFLSHAHVNPTYSMFLYFCIIIYLLNIAQILFLGDVWVWHFFLSGALVLLACVAVRDCELFVEAQLQGLQASWFGDLPGSGHFWPFAIMVVDSF